MARTQYGDQDMVGNRVVNLANGTNPDDAATVLQADEVVVSTTAPTGAGAELWINPSVTELGSAMVTISTEPPSGEGIAVGHLWIQF